MKRLMTVVIVVAILGAAFTVPVVGQSETRSYLVIAANQLPGNLAQKVAAAGGTITATIPQIGIAVVATDNPNFAADAVGIGGVRSVVPNITLQWIDPQAGEGVGFDYGNPPTSGDDDFFFDLQWGHDAVDAPEAWDAGFRGAGATVAVLDGGFDLDHPDLEPNINFALSMDFTGEGLQYGLPDTFSHGSHTAGTVAAADNGFGTIGVAPEAELILVKVLGDAGSGSFEDVMAGIVYAADVGADVISMSLGAYVPHRGYLEDDGTWVGANEIAELLVALGRATTYAYQQGVTVIASAGNGGIDGNTDKDLLHIPSDSPHVISISATAPIGWGVDPTVSLDNLASYSNYGVSVIDLAAPGGDYLYYFVDPAQMCTVAGVTRPCYVFDYVFSTGNGGWYWSAGTSMAAPHVSGVAAIIIGANGGDMHPAQVEAALRASADDLGKPGKDAYYGHGRVNAYNYVH